MSVTWVMIAWLTMENKKLDKLLSENPGQLSSTGRPMTGDITEFKARGQAPERFRYII
jgi:hypothetical protein